MLRVRRGGQLLQPLHHWFNTDSLITTKMTHSQSHCRRTEESPAERDTKHKNQVFSVDSPLNLPPPPSPSSVWTNIVMICAASEDVLLTIKLSGYQTVPGQDRSRCGTSR